MEDMNRSCSVEYWAKSQREGKAEPKIKWSVPQSAFQSSSVKSNFVLAFSLALIRHAVGSRHFLNQLEAKQKSRDLFGPSFLVLTSQFWFNFVTLVLILRQVKMSTSWYNFARILLSWSMRDCALQVLTELPISYLNYTAYRGFLFRGLLCGEGSARGCVLRKIPGRRFWVMKRKIIVYWSTWLRI